MHEVFEKCKFSYGFSLDCTALRKQELVKPLLQRAIGVIYRPNTERWSHYYLCDLQHQFDLVLYHDHTYPVIPLSVGENYNDETETFPYGI